LIDNVVGSLGGASMDAALTGSEWSDRVLGASATVKLPLVITWYCTGNNIQLSGDMSRRVLHIRLESPDDHPEERAGFTHDDPVRIVRENRGWFVGAALTILRAYCLADRPRQNIQPW